MSPTVHDWCWSCGTEFVREVGHECEPGPARSVMWAADTTPSLLLVTEESLENLARAIRDGKADT